MHLQEHFGVKIKLKKKQQHIIQKFTHHFLNCYKMIKIKDLPFIF